MAAIHIHDTLDQQFEAFAHNTGEAKDDLVGDALLSYLEDRQDAAIATARYKNIGKRTACLKWGENLAWTIEFSEDAKRDLRKLDKSIHVGSTVTSACASRTQTIQRSLARALSTN